MPHKKLLDPDTQLTSRQKQILFALVKEYCDNGQSLGSKELKERYDFPFSSATIRNEFVELRDLGFLYQPFLNSSSKPTEKAFKIFIQQLLVGLQVTSRQQQDLKRQIMEMEEKQANLSKEISRLLAFETGGLGFSLDTDRENISGLRNLIELPGEGKVADILDFLDRLDEYKPLLLEGGIQHSTDSRLRTFIGDDNPIIPLGNGYAMVATDVYIDNNGKKEKSVVGMITPIHLIANKKNLALVDAISKLLGNSDESDN